MKAESVAVASKLLEKRNNILDMIGTFQSDAKLCEARFYFDGYTALDMYDLYRKVNFDRDHFSTEVCRVVMDILLEDLRNCEEELSQLGVEDIKPQVPIKWSVSQLENPA